MYRKPITYVDFNGETRTEDFYFNLTKSEIMKLELGIVGGLTEHINKCIQTQNIPGILELFDKIILGAYGEKSADGRRFVKSAEISEAFAQTGAYDVLFQEITSDVDKANEFMEGILPADAVAAAKNQKPAVKANN